MVTRCGWIYGFACDDQIDVVTIKTPKFMGDESSRLPHETHIKSNLPPIGEEYGRRENHVERLSLNSLFRTLRWIGDRYCYRLMNRSRWGSSAPLYRGNVLIARSRAERRMSFIAIANGKRRILVARRLETSRETCAGCQIFSLPGNLDSSWCHTQLRGH